MERTLHGRGSGRSGKGRVDPWPLRERALLLVVASGFLAALWLPALPRLATHFIGAEGVDQYGTQWFYWFVARGVGAGEGFGFTRLLFFPFGKDIFLHTGSNVLDAIVAFPFRWLFGPVLGYNLFVLAGWGLGAAAAWWLARSFTSDRTAIAAATLFFLAAPYGLYELEAGRPTQALIGAIPLYVGLLWRMGRERGRATPLLAGLVLAFVGYQYWYYAIFLALVSVVHAACRFLAPPEGSGGRQGVMLRHAVVAGVAIALCAPVAGPMLARLSSDTADVPGLLETDAWTLSRAPTITREGTQVALMVWQPASMTSGHYWQDGQGAERYMPFQHSLTWVALPWLLVWLARPGTLERRTWLVMLLTAGLVAVGPAFVVARSSLPNPVYLGLARALPPLARLWWPGRSLAVVTALLVPVMAVAMARAGARGRGWLGLSLAACALVFLWELERSHLLPFPTWDANVPSGYRCLAEGDRSGAILELPYAWSQAHLYYQTVHGRPIFGGMLEDNASFTPPGTVALKGTNTFVAALFAIAKQARAVAQPTLEDRDALHRLGYRYVVLQLDAYWAVPPRPGLLDNARRTLRRRVLADLAELLGDPVYRDARVAIFAPWGDGPPCDADAWPMDLEPPAPPPPERHLAGRVTDPAFAVHRVALPP